MKIISWNVNGLKAIMNKNFKKSLSQLNADFVCLQEIKTCEDLLNVGFEKYYKYFNYSKKSGYSGVGILTKSEPINIIMGMEIENEYGEMYQADNEARLITLEYDDLYLVNVYVPHSSKNERKIYRQKFDNSFIEYVEQLEIVKNTIICGDFNIHKNNIDICNFQKHNFINHFEDEERANFQSLLDIGFIDSYRYMHPQMREFSFWTNSDNRETKDAGWRLDYILVSNYLKSSIREANILKEIGGSDHCPVELIIKM